MSRFARRIVELAAAVVVLGGAVAGTRWLAVRTGWVVALAAVGVAWLALFLRGKAWRRRECPEGGLYPECRFRVTGDDEGVACQPPDAPAERVRWSDLATVDVQTTSGGPWAMDFWWVLRGDSGAECAVPQGATGEAALIERVRRLPGFDAAALGDAIRCTDDRVFRCWTRTVEAAAGE